MEIFHIAPKIFDPDELIWQPPVYLAVESIGGLFWDEFCPEFPWVGPLWKDETSERKRRTVEDTVDYYLGEYWLGADGIQKIHFRQFAWRKV